MRIAWSQIIRREEKTQQIPAGQGLPVEQPVSAPFGLSALHASLGHFRIPKGQHKKMEGKK